MLDIEDRSGFALWQRLQQLFQLLLALAERQRAKIHSISEQQIERKEDELVGLAVGNRSLQRREIRVSLLIERDDLAVDQTIGQRTGLLGDGQEFVGPVQPFAGSKHSVAVLDPHLHAVAVELDLMAP